jgi:hypothetical protein
MGLPNNLGRLSAGLTADASLNIGVGVTPSSWASGGGNLQLKNGVNISWSGQDGYLAANQYYNGSNSIYISNGTATQYTQETGVHKWFNAPSGTAGGVITFTERMRLFSDGNLLLQSGGTFTNAGYKLDVNGTGRFTSSVTTTQLISLSASGSAALFLKDGSANNKWEIGHITNSLYFYNYTRGGNDLILNGSTGAATFSSSVQATSLIVNQTSTASDIALRFNINGTTKWLAGLINDVVDDNFTIYQDGAGGGNRFTINTSGNVGIGTTSPSAKLDVVGDIRIRRTADPTQYMDIFPSGGEGYIDAINSASATAQTLIFRRANNVGYYESMRITSGGYTKMSNNGVYNDATGSYHEVRQTTASQNISVFRNAGADPYGLDIGYSAASPNNTSNNFIYCFDSTALRATIRSNGGLANYSGNNVNLASDRRLKKDIVSLSSEWDKLKQIEVVNFKYKDSEDSTSLYGAIAQQIKEIYPDLVVVTREATETEPEYYGLREQPFQWLTTKVLQEAMVKIEEQQAQIKELQSQINK